ncbi:PadR family transcriptional regulator [Gemmatimonadota bacterium]
MTKGNYLGEFELVVLLALARLGEPSSGMPIYDEICATTGRDVSVHSVYVTLGRMEKKGYVSSRQGESSESCDPGGPTRKCYELLPGGVSALQQSRAMYDNLWAGVRLTTGAREP